METIKRIVRNLTKRLNKKPIEIKQRNKYEDEKLKWEYETKVNIIEKKVNRYTRAPRTGKNIKCPKCGNKNKVYHFSWNAITCGACKKMIEKYDWIIP